MWTVKRNRRKRESRRWRWHWPAFDWRPLAGLAGLAAGAGVLTWLLAGALDRPVTRVQVQGRFQRVSPLEVQQSVEAFAIEGFLSIDLEAVKRSIESLPWVDSVRVERSWPNGIRLNVTEQVAAARWGDSGLLNTRGELFVRDAPRIPPELPRLDGPEGAESRVARLYLDTYPQLLAIGLRLTRVRLDARGAWELELANGVQVRLGRQDVTARLERFLDIASQLIATRQGDVAYVDMRYSNGFAVGWQAQVAGAAGHGEDSTPDA